MWYLPWWDASETCLIFHIYIYIYMSHDYHIFNSRVHIHININIFIYHVCIRLYCITDSKFVNDASFFLVWFAQGKQLSFNHLTYEALLTSQQHQEASHLLATWHDSEIESNAFFSNSTCSLRLWHYWLGVWRFIFTGYCSAGQSGPCAATSAYPSGICITSPGAATVSPRGSRYSPRQRTDPPLSWILGDCVTVVNFKLQDFNFDTNKFRWLTLTTDNWARDSTVPSHLVIFSKEGPDWLMTKALQSIAKNLQHVFVQKLSLKDS